MRSLTTENYRRSHDGIGYIVKYHSVFLFSCLIEVFALHIKLWNTVEMMLFWLALHFFKQKLLYHFIILEVIIHIYQLIVRDRSILNFASDLPSSQSGLGVTSTEAVVAAVAAGEGSSGVGYTSSLFAVAA